jgi:hypothetical protein
MMTQTEIDHFNEANKKEHKVEDEWFYSTMTKYGFTPDKTSAIGFVRSYMFRDLKGHEIRCAIGVNADYWESKDPKGFGYWSDLEPFLKNLA